MYKQFFVRFYIVCEKYTSYYAHFTFADIIWPLLLSPNFGTQMKPLAETECVISCISFAQNVYIATYWANAMCLVLSADVCWHKHDWAFLSKDFWQVLAFFLSWIFFFSDLGWFLCSLPVAFGQQPHDLTQGEDSFFQLKTILIFKFSKHKVEEMTKNMLMNKRGPHLFSAAGRHLREPCHLSDQQIWNVE